jgi:sigma-B regulation protein RsbU (phosphoserine phosphatase)
VESNVESCAGSLLVVDDNADSRAALAHLLEGHGYTVKQGGGGRHALKLLAEGKVDLVLLDVMMQDLNGLEVLEIVRASYSAAELPVIMATARDQSDDIVRALRLGANDYVTKPLDLRVLLARIQTQLSLKRAVEQVRRLEQNLARQNKELEAANIQLRAANLQMEQDLEAAARIQQAFLPPPSLDVPGVDVAWLYKPCAQLAGETLNVFRLDHRHVGVYVLDVSGHGVAAALLAATLSHVISPRAEPGSLLLGPAGNSAGYRPVQPAEVADALNERFPLDPVKEQYFTLIYGVLDVATGEFRYVSAGHPGPTYIPASGSAKMLKEPGLPVGVGKGVYAGRSIQLRPGDRLYLYSDGLFEAMNGEHELYGTGRLLQALEAVRVARLADGLDAVWRGLEEFRGDAVLQDDVSILAVEYKGHAKG